MELVSKIEVYYKSGETLAIIADSKYMKFSTKMEALLKVMMLIRMKLFYIRKMEIPFIFTDARPLLHIMKTMQFCLKLKTEKK